jgi:thiol-disulfide isomerase/thioredoxin
VKWAVFAIGLLLSGCKKEPAGAPPSAGVAFHELKPGNGALPSLIAAEVQKARAQNLKPVVYVSATWCGPCNALKHSLDDPQMVDAFRGAYVIKLDLDAWEAPLKAAGYQVDSVPVFFQLDAAGRPTGKNLTGAAWQDDVPANMAPPIKAFLAQAAS